MIYDTEISEKKKRPSALFGIVLIFFLIAVIIYSGKSREVLLEAMIMCAKTVVPSVFVFAVAGNLIGSGVACFPRFLTLPISKIFGVGREGAGALLPGLFAGFPVGVSAAVRLYERGAINKYELCRISAFSCTPGVAFVISGVGEGMLGDKKAGVIIYISVMISVFAVGYFTRKRSLPKEDIHTAFASADNIDLPGALAKAVTKSGSAMIVMTSFVLFFSQISFFITPLASFTAFPELSEAIIKSLLEVSQACRAAAELDKTLGMILSAFACAWSGISFQMQTFALGGKYFGTSDLVRIAIFRLFTALSACAISAVICKVLEIT
ncbi:MAG: hypothetical protein J6M35_02940 [Clostridia bacterium]|nr:hypothetical protein [Clostridia bacterium]